MDWTITYYNNQVQEDILNLPTGLLARYLRLTEMIEKHGPFLGMPHTRAMGDGLYELRIRSKEGIARAFYYIKENNVVILHNFIKKTMRTPKRELEIARRRIREYKDDKS